MAGLLDSVFGDAETKDEFGQTERDRRQPIWSGLMKAGLLAYAGGGRLMPEDRAKYYAEAGGALAGIPTDMVGQASANAQQKLRGQQLAEAQRKVTDRDKVRALAQSPEVQEALAKAKGVDRVSIQAAIDTGDMAALNTAVGNLDKTGLRTQQLDLATQKLDLAREKANRGGLQGNGLQTQMYNQILAAVNSGKPEAFMTPEYRAAYDFITKDQTTKDANGQIVKIPGIELPWAPTPTYQHPGAPTPTPTPTPDTPPVPGAPKQVPGQAQKPLPEPQMKVFTNGAQQLTKIETVLDDLDKYPDIAIGTGAAQVLGRLPLGSAGADALNKMDPNGVRARALIADIGSMQLHDRSGAAVTLSEYPRLAPFVPKVTDSPDEIRKKLASLKQGIDIEMSFHHGNIPQGTMIPPEITSRYGRPVESAYVGAKGEHSWADIVETARNQGVTVNDVIRKYGLKPKGGQ